MTRDNLQAITEYIHFCWMSQRRSMAYLLFIDDTKKYFPFIKSMLYDGNRDCFQIVFNEAKKEDKQAEVERV